MSNTTFCFTVDDIYGAGWFEKNRAELDRLYEWEFRRVKQGEELYSTYPGSGVIPYLSNFETVTPHIVITKRKPSKPTIKEIYGTDTPEIPEGWVSTGEVKNSWEKGEVWLTLLVSGVTVVRASFDDETPVPENYRLKLRRPTLKDIYNTETVRIPTGYVWTGEVRTPRGGEKFLSRYDCVASYVYPDLIPNSYPRLILKPRPPKVWFAAEQKTRFPKKGDWLWSPSSLCWGRADADFQCLEFLCATRHEEPELTEQTVTEADVAAYFEKKGIE